MNNGHVRPIRLWHFDAVAATLYKSLGSPITLMSLSKQNPLESLSEIFVKYCVDDRVKGRVTVPQPKCKGKPPALDTTGGCGVILTDGADWADTVEEKEGEPACNKTAHDQTQNKCGSAFFFSGDSFLFSIRLFFYRRLDVVADGWGVLLLGSFGGFGSRHFRFGIVLFGETSKLALLVVHVGSVTQVDLKKLRHSI